MQKISIEVHRKKYIRTFFVAVCFAVLIFSAMNRAVFSQESEPTLSMLYNKTSTYIESPTNHGLTKLGNLSLPDNSITVKINNEIYYYIPNSDEDKTFLKLLSAYGDSCIKATNDASKAVYSYNGLFYTYDIDKLLKSAYTLTETSVSGVNTIKKYEYNSATGEYESKNYNVSLNPLNLNKGNISYSTDSAGADGSVLVNMPKDTNQELFYKYNQPSGWSEETNLVSVTVTDNNNGYEFEGNGAAGHYEKTDVVELNDRVYKNNKINIEHVYRKGIQDSAIAYARGGAIYNKGTITSLRSDFVENAISINEDKSYTWGAFYVNGGAISNLGRIESITGDFIKNSVSGEKGDLSGGGAIYNQSEFGEDSYIGSISGDFVQNGSISVNQASRGGAIYNYSLGGVSEIGDIDAAFVGNYAKGNNANGGAIAQYSQYTENGAAEKIGNIRGSFIGNYAATTTTGSDAYGGAIYNRSDYYNANLSIGDINADFIGNYVQSVQRGNGGAIYNAGTNGNVSIGNIIGDFVSNSVSVLSSNNTQVTTAYGGAIYNNKDTSGTGSVTLGYISGIFLNNGVRAESVTYSADAYGGAIYNTATIGDTSGSIINSSFINNYAIANSSSLDASVNAKGGAIYTTKNLMIVADDYTSTFSGNYVQEGEGARAKVTSEAIFVDSTDAKLTFNAKNNGKFLINDQINGIDGYSLEFVGDNSGVADVNNLIKGAPVVNVDTVTVNYNTINNSPRDVTSFSSLNVSNNGAFKTMIDFDIKNKWADNFYVAENSSGIIDITKVNIIKPDEQFAISDSFVVQILTTRNSDLQLNLSDDSVLSRFLIYHIEGTKEEDDSVKTVTNWTDSYYHHVYSDADLYGVLSPDTTSTKNDSIRVTTELVGTDTKTSLGDTLFLVNESDLQERTFSTADKAAQYDLSTDLNDTSAGKFNINGAKDENSISTLNLNGNKGFNLSNETQLNLKDVKLTGNDTLINVANDNASVSVDGAEIDGNITTTNENGYALDITGNSKFNGKVGKANATLTNGTLAMGTDTFSEANLTAASGTVNLSNNSTENYNIGTLASSEDVTYILDFDVENKTADTITTANASSGPVIIDGINFVGGKTFADLPEDMRENIPYVVRILYTQNDDLYLELSDTAKAIVGNNEYIIGQDTREVADVVQAETPWSENYYNIYNQVVTNYGDIKIMSSGADDGTVNDSIGISYSGTEYGEKTFLRSQGDTLKVVNQADLETRSFVTNDSSAVYKLSDDLGETSSGTLNVTGKTEVVVTPADPNDPTSYEMSETKTSTLDFNSHDGFVMVNDNTTINFKDVKLTGAKNIATSNNETSTISFDNVEIVDNDFGVKTAGGVNIKGNSYIGSPIELTSANGSINVDGTDGVTVNSNLSGAEGSQLKISNGTVDLKENAKITSLNTTLQNTSLNVSDESVMDGNNLTVQDVSAINMNNGAIGTMNFADMLLNGDLNISADVDLSQKKMDMLTAETYNPDSVGVINVNNLTLLSPSKSKKIRIPFTNQTLANHVKYTGQGTVVYSPVYKYATSYNDQDGYFTFSRGGSGRHTSYNPAILSSQVSALAGIYGTQLQTFSYGFQHSDIYMDMPVSKRLAEKNENKYAFDSISAAGMYSPLMTKNDKSGFWVKPYAVFEKVNLNHGPKVSNMNYGAMFGFDTSLQRIRGGFDRVFTYYIGYSGSTQGYNNVDIYQNGGLIGFTTSLYRGNFFNATTLSVGASIGDASSRFGSDTFTSLHGGIANKIGYNFEFKEGRFIIQPSFIIGYSFIDTFKYRTKSGVSVKSDPYNIIHLAPGLKLIANTKNGWQPYIGLQLVWDIMVSSGVTAGGIHLPEMNFDPYFQYGLGIQRLFSDRFMFFGQAMVRNGGRNGVAVSAGMRWIFGE